MPIPANIPQIVEVEIKQIRVGERQRDDIGNIPELARSIQEIGLLNPIILEDDFMLRAGYRRLMAHMFLERTTIPARFWGQLTELEQQQIELEENIRRKQLNWQEEVAAKAKLHELMQLKHPQPLPQGKQSGPGQPPKAWGLKDTADLLRESVSQVSQDLTLAKAMTIIPEIKNMASKTNAMRVFRKNMELAALMEMQSRKGQQKNSASDSRIECGDCYDLLLNVKDASVDLVITDPPWGIEIGAAAREWVRLHDTFADSEDDAIEVTKIALAHCFRVLKDGSHLYFFCAWHLMHHWQAYLEQIGFWVRPAPLIWVKGNVTAGQPFWKFMSKTECILFAHKGQGGRILAAPSSDVLQYDAPRTRIHPTEKPTDMLRYLIGISTVEGEVVLDPFAGSGSTIKAAMLSNRVGIGFELDPEMAKKAQANILSIEVPNAGQEESGTPAAS